MNESVKSVTCVRSTPLSCGIGRSRKNSAFSNRAIQPPAKRTSSWLNIDYASRFLLGSWRHNTGPLSTILNDPFSFGCESLNLFSRLFWSIFSRFSRSSLDGRKDLVKGIFDCHVDLFVLNRNVIRNIGSID